MENTPYNKNNLTERPLSYYTDLFAAADPAEIAERTEAEFDGKAFHLHVLNKELVLSWPKADDDGWRDKDKILFLHYLLEGRKVGPASGFMAYNEFPSGDLYDRNFRARCVNRLVGTFGTRVDAFCAMCEKIGGHRIEGSGIAYEVEFMKNLFLKMIIWEGDDEFPASGQMIFSNNFGETFESEDRVVVCEYTLGQMR